MEGTGRYCIGINHELFLSIYLLDKHYDIYQHIASGLILKQKILQKMPNLNFEGF